MRATAALANADWSRYATYLQSRPDEAELAAIRLMLSLVPRIRISFAHRPSFDQPCASGTARRPRRRASGKGGDLSALSASRRGNHSRTVRRCSKCAPPIRSRENRERLWQGLKEGTIDMVVTDHSPCPPAMKRISEGNFQTAWGGIASLSVALPLMWTEASERGFTLLDLARWMSRNRRAGRMRHAQGPNRRRLRCGLGSIRSRTRIYCERRADCTIGIRSPPYLGETLRGVVRATYLRGNPVFIDETFPGQPAGREFRRACAS